MQILLSCAKTMAESTSLPIPRTTSPLYGAQAGELAGQLATLSTEELAKILRVNHRIADEEVTASGFIQFVPDFSNIGRTN